MTERVSVSVDELTALGIDVALEVLCEAPEGSSSNWSVLGPWLEQYQWELSFSEDTSQWSGSSTDLTYSDCHSSLKTLVARLRLLEALSGHEDSDVVFRMEGAKARELFEHTNAASKIIYANRDYSEGQIELVLRSV